MVKDAKLLASFEQAQLRQENLTYKQALKIIEALWQEGRTLGVLPPQNPLDGIETDIKIARILNKCSSK